MRWTLVAIVVSAACGRANFDLVGDGSTGDGLGDGALVDGVVSPVTFVQTNSTGGAINVTAMVPLSGVTAGDLLVAVIDYDSTTPTLTGITDSRANFYSIAGPHDGNSTRMYVAYTIAGSSGAVTITATISSLPTTFIELRVFEYRGIRATAPLIGSSGGGGNTTTADGAFTIVDASPGDLVFGACIFESISGGTAGTGFTVRSMFAGDVVEDRIASGSGLTNVTATMAAGGAGWAILGASFHHQ